MEKTKTTKNIKEKDWNQREITHYYFFANVSHDISQCSRKVTISLSAGAIGLLVGISNLLSFSSIWQIIFFLLSLIAFTVPILLIIQIWGFLNLVFQVDIKTYKNVNPEINTVEEQGKKDFLNKHILLFSKISFYSFLCAIVLMATFTSITIYEKYNSKTKNTIQGVQVMESVQTYPVLHKTK